MKCSTMFKEALNQSMRAKSGRSFVATESGNKLRKVDCVSAFSKVGGDGKALLFRESRFVQRLFRYCMALCLLLGIIQLSGRTSAEDSEFLPDGTGDLLLVHGKNLTEDETSQVERLVTMAAALGKTMDFGTAEQCEDMLEQYDYVILYEAEDISSSFGIVLNESGARRMIIGSATMRRYLTLTDEAGRIGQDEPQENGKLTYAFPSGKEYQCIAHWEGLFRFQPEDYQSGILQAGNGSYPFCTEVAGTRFIPVTDLSQTLVRAALMQELSLWMWPYENSPTEYAQFLVLDSVYPFMPASRLLEIIEQVEEISVPYVISVMPPTDNYDYPAMTQFCQVLAYAQSQGASVILHAPILHKTLDDEDDVEELLERLTEMTMAYIHNGVYPLGIEVPDSWLNEERYLRVLERYRTVFVYDDGNSTHFDLNAHTSLISRQGHQLVYPLLDLEQEGLSQLHCYSSAAYVDCGSASETFLQYAKSGKSGGNPFMDLRNYDHQVWLNDYSLTYQNHTVYLNEERMETSFVPSEYDVDFDFQRSPLKRMSIDLQSQNHVLLAVVAVLLAAFLAGIVYARYRMRKRFFSDAGARRDGE